MRTRREMRPASTDPADMPGSAAGVMAAIIADGSYPLAAHGGLSQPLHSDEGHPKG
jgi:hypothetical protein